MIDRRRFLHLIAGSLVVSQWPGALFELSGQAAAIPGAEPSQKQGRFEFDSTPERLRIPLLSLDGTGVQAIQYQCAADPCFEALPCARGDAHLANSLAAIHALPVTNPFPGGIDHFFLVLFAEGNGENLQWVLELAKEARSICAFIVALIVETEDTDSARWSSLAVEASLDGLWLIPPASLSPQAATLAPGLVQPLEALCLAALRAHTDLLWHQSMINVDFVDYGAVLKGQGSGRIGIGSATRAVRGETKAETAAQLGLESLAGQGVNPGQAQGFWVSIFAGKDFTLEDFDEVSRVIYEAADEEANVIIGLFVAEEFAETITVTILAG